MFTIDTRNLPITTKEQRAISRRQKQTAPTESVTDSSLYADRRRRPERRRGRRDSFQQSDRRRRLDRRMPKLLNAKNGQPEAMEERKGANIDTAI